MEALVNNSGKITDAKAQRTSFVNGRNLN